MWLLSRPKDIPESATQFGTLVVSLPCQHEGCQLIVRHGKQEVTFDWSSSVVGSNSIQWGAFYSGCKHEVRVVREGHCVTLTYNLYRTLDSGDLTGACSVMDVKHLPLYKRLRKTLARSDFMPSGGLLGMACRHAYHHTSSEAPKLLPSMLKGADMAVYEIVRALGLHVEVRSVLDHKNYYMYDYALTERDAFDHTLPSDGVITLRYYHRLGILGNLYTTPAERDGDYSYAEIAEKFGETWKKVLWLTKPKWREIGLVHTTENADCMDWIDCFAALIVTVPRVGRRPKEWMEEEVEKAGADNDVQMS